jgi:formate hydrogenlyase transcriptional activator
MSLFEQGIPLPLIMPRPIVPASKKNRPETGTTKSVDATAAEMEQWVKENEILFSINKDIASIKEKKDVFHIVLPKLKELFATEDVFICRLDAANKTLNPFLRIAGKQRQLSKDYETILSAHLPIHDGFIDSILCSPSPVIFDLHEVARRPAPPSYISITIATGLAESLSAALLCGESPIGILTFWSEKKGAFTAYHERLIKRLAYQISIVVNNIADSEEIKQKEKEKEILLTVSKELNSIREKKDLLPILKRQLDDLSFYSDVTITKVDANNKTFSAFIINEDSDRVKHPGYTEMANAHHPFPDGVFELALHAIKPVVFDVRKLATGPNPLPYIKFIHDNGTIDMVGVALRDRNREIGALFLFSDRKLSFSELQLSLVQGIGNQLGTVMANILANEEIAEQQFEKTILLSLSSEIASVRKKDDLFRVINSKLKDLFGIEGFGISLINEDGETYKPFIVGVNENISNHPDFNAIINQSYSITDGVFDKVIRSKEPVALVVDEILENKNVPPYALFWKKSGIEFVAGMALSVGEVAIGGLFFHLDPIYFGSIRSNLLIGVSAQISIALSNILANEKIAQQLEEISRYKEQLEEEKQYLQSEAGAGYTYSDIIGNSSEMKKVFQQLSQVSFASSTVLILGETGTGKELVARAIHNSSPRKSKLMVKVNCATLPASLVESELFGHEKGSFTGATDRRIGKFELANNGSLFLDEIGELPSDMQVKLLRAIQEKEIERIGGKSTIKVNVRIIAATNRHLQKEVDDGRFRQDLFYRLNVFPIILPPLRDRKEDIPLLVSHFIERYSKNTGKSVQNISGKAMKELIAYNWPGNVRELEHLIERSVLMATGSTIKQVHLPSGKLLSKTKNEEESLKTFEENERDYIIKVLNRCNGKIYGPGGAAVILNLRVSTLNSKIKKLGIKKNKLYS